MLILHSDHRSPPFTVSATTPLPAAIVRLAARLVSGLALVLFVACSPGGAGNSNQGGSGGRAEGTASGGISATGGMLPVGGKSGTGVSVGFGGSSVIGSAGGQPGSGGISMAAQGGGQPGRGGQSVTGGADASASQLGTGGNATGDYGGSTGTRDGGAGSTAGVNGSGSLDGGTGNTGPCDIYAAGNTPCAAAHSTVRALYGAYNGPLYQVRRASDGSTSDIPVLAAGSYADAAVQDTFCANTTCTISVVYDQSPSGNDLTKSPPGGWLTNGGLEANATAAKISVSAHTVYGVYTTSSFDNNAGSVGYRNNKTKGVATGDNPEAIYMVASGKHYNQYCCFDYGNAETNSTDDGSATMEAVYFGNSTQWGKGSGSGPWVMADFENGVFAGGSTAAQSTNTSLDATYVTAMLKGPSGNRFVLKGGDAQSGALVTEYDGSRPAGYSPMAKQGAIVMGVGGDNSHSGEGTFFEGCITSGFPSDATDDAVQANIVAAYGP